MIKAMKHLCFAIANELAGPTEVSTLLIKSAQGGFGKAKSLAVHNTLKKQIIF